MLAHFAGAEYLAAVYAGFEFPGPAAAVISSQAREQPPGFACIDTHPYILSSMPEACLRSRTRVRRVGTVSVSALVAQSHGDRLILSFGRILWRVVPRSRYPDAELRRPSLTDQLGGLFGVGA
mgnify:CR=1 FL=1